MTTFQTVAEKVHAEVALDMEDGLVLFGHKNLAELGVLANSVRERLHGDRTYYNRNFHINATNVCVASCMFCSFARLKEGDPGAYTMTLEQAWAKLEARKHEPITEIHIVNGLHPDLPFGYYEELLAGIKRIRPDIHLKAFTAVEIHFFAEKFGLNYEEVLGRLKAAGLGSLPGGGAEIFAERVRRKICHDKATAAEWLEVHRTAHRLGLRSNATMLYGHIETAEERIDHMLRIRDLQAETGGFQTFIPLAFHPEGNSLRKLAAPTGFEDLRVYAVSRLMLGNVAHIKAYWIMLGIKIAQVSMAFGVDDIDGTVEEEKIYHMAGAKTPEALTPSALEALIRAAGRIPVERDTLYQTPQPAPLPMAMASPGMPGTAGTERPPVPPVPEATPA